MATLVELARGTGLDGAALGHLHRLVASWDLLADLCFADLLLYVPVVPDPSDDDGEGQPAEEPAGDRFVILGQVRPTTSQTLYREDRVGQVVSADEHPLVARAWQLGQIIDGEVRVGDEIASVQCIPVRWKDSLLGVLTRESAPSVGRRPGELERVYVEIFDRFARMMMTGEFPYGAEAVEPEDAPRVGDGVARLDATARVDYASPNFVSALHRMRIHDNVRGARLAEIGFDESPVRGAFAIGLPITEEVERADVAVLVWCFPLLDNGVVTGAVVLMRDVSDLRRRDRLLISKDVTIREMHHRVKNNLQTISSLLRLQGRRLESQEAKEAVEQSVRRIRSIALVHETLSRATSQEVDFDEIVRPLVRTVEEGLLSPERQIKLVVEGDAGELRAEVATPLAVVLTELLQNAVTHGYPFETALGDLASAQGTVTVSLSNDGTELSVRVQDDGVGLPGDFNIDDTHLGLTIVRDLVTHELGGRIEMRAAPLAGTLVEVCVPIGAGRDAANRAGGTTSTTETLED